MTEIEKLKERLFVMGAVKNFKFDSPLIDENCQTPGELVEEIAEQINNALDEIAAGLAEEIDPNEEDEDCHFHGTDFTPI